MNIGKYFYRRNKKSDLSDQSEADKDPKRQRVQSPNVSCLEIPTSAVHIFQESLKSDNCIQILMNRLKSMMEKVKKPHSLAKSNH